MASLELMSKADDKDFELSVGRERVMVHKLILINRCEYFQRMLQHETVENKENRVIIGDFYSDTVKSFVHYLYTDEIQCSEELVAELLILADKYRMLALKRKCSKQLRDQMDVTSAIDMLIFADKYNCQKLKRTALFIIRDNIHAVRKSEEYKKLEELSHLKDSIIDVLSGCSAGDDGVNHTNNLGYCNSEECSGYFERWIMPRATSLNTDYFVSK